MTFFRKATIAAALAATALATTTPAMARDYHRGNDNTAAVAIGAGILGLAVGAIVASSSNRDDRYSDQGYYADSYYGPAYTTSWSYRDGYYWDRDGRRHSRDEYQRYHQSHDRRDGNYRDNNRHDDRRDGDYRRGYDRSYSDQRRGY